MREFIEVQYRLYQAGGRSITIDKIKALADVYLTPEERTELFGGEEE